MTTVESDPWGEDRPLVERYRTMLLDLGGLIYRVLAALREEGLTPVRTAADDPVAVAQGSAPEVDWRQLAEASYAVARGPGSPPSTTCCTRRHRRPTHVVTDLRGLFRAPPWVRGTDDRYTRGPWRTRRQGDEIVLEGGPGDPADGARVLCHAVWTARDGGRPTAVAAGSRDLLRSRPGRASAT